ncbi:MAG: nuclear transport factor 2 family protein [Acidobacteria bacterium]|nr:nuclear transport factor 2 family protein [Acidobacteriota bacterium]
MTFERSEVSAAFDRFVAVGDSGDWNAWADLHSPNGVWVERHLGTFNGREENRTAITSVMAMAPTEMSFPVEWSVIDGDRVVFYPWQVLPDPTGGGREFRFGCVTILTYAGEGLWSYQEDVYNPAEGERVITEWLEAGGSLPAGSGLLGD